MQTSITNRAVLKSVAATLHDARFTYDAVGFDAAARTFSLKCWVLERKPEAIGASRYWQGFRLAFTNVADCKLNRREKVPYYELATIRLREHERQLDLVAHYGTEISLIIENLEGALAETNETREKWE